MARTCIICRRPMRQSKRTCNMINFCSVCRMKESSEYKMQQSHKKILNGIVALKGN